MIRLAFVMYPEDWIGRTICVFPDGKAMLAESLFGRERLAAGELPRWQMRIERGMTSEQIQDWLTKCGAL